MFIVHFQNVHFWRAEEAQAEDGANAAGDKDAVVVFKGEEAGGHGGAHGDDFTGEGVANLAAVGVA